MPSFKFPLFWHYAAPKFQAMLFCDFHTGNFNIVEVVDWNGFVVYSGHAILKLFPKGRGSNFGFGRG
jgi:hypothetical protein